MEYTDEEYKTIFHNAHEMAVEAKKMEEENEGISPQCIMGFDGIVIPALMSGVGPGEMNDACKKAINIVLNEVKPKIEKVEGKQFGPLLWIAIVSEVYIQEYNRRDGESDEEFVARLAERKKAGNIRLEPLFKQGDMSVREAITTVGIYPGGQHNITQTFRWTPVDGYEWDEIRETSEPGDDRWTYLNMVEGV